jgi:class 3 adenylate cyclase
MPPSESTDLQTENALLKRRLNVICELDSIRDEYEDEDLREQLLESLKFLARELDATSAFVSYYDAYKRKHDLDVDSDGLMKRDEFGIVQQLCTMVEETGNPVAGDPRLFPGNFYAIPLLLPKGLFVGIVGIGKRETDGDGKFRAITNDEIVLLADASTVLDTAIRKRTKEMLQTDELSLIDAFDEINDRVFADLTECLSKMLPLLTTRLEAKAALIFRPITKEWEPLACDSSGRILWETSQPMKLEIKLRVQQSEGHREPIIRSYKDDSHDRVIMGRPIRSMVVQPLRTKTGETAGTLVILSDKSMHDGHFRLISQAAAQLDTVILSRRHTEVMARRYGKYVGSQTLNVLLDTPEWLDPRKESVVILSADLVGSTEYASKERNPFTVFEHINEYLGLMGTIVKNTYHGTLDKYIGDEVMGVFGAPVPDADRSVNAIECARSILKEIDALNQQRELNEKPIFQVKVTLGLAECVVGEVGSVDTQTDYTVIGDDVNRLFRIARHAEPGRIIVNKALRDELTGDYEFEFVKKVDDAKGIDESISVYALKWA